MGWRGGAKKAPHPRTRALAALLLAFAVLVTLPPFAWPIKGRVSSGFFIRHAPDSSRLLAIEMHRGIDIAAASGTPVHSTAPGIVVETGYSASLGNYVRVRHLLGITSTYGHLSRIDAPKGRLILLRGARSLGAVGTTGRSTGPHLHFAIEVGKLFLPPRPLLAFHDLRRHILHF
jgi:murein DD-endopeptidase MepM/ murein hydrolase activator NlpD